jgi:hypothetical protein
MILRVYQLGNASNDFGELQRHLCGTHMSLNRLQPRARGDGTVVHGWFSVSPVCLWRGWLMS